MAAEVITLTANGATWTAFEDVSVRAGIDEAARSFRLRLALEAGGLGTAQTFQKGVKVVVSANGEPLATGIVDKYEPGFSEKEARCTVSGRSLSKDMIDSSAVHATGHFENKTLDAIAKEIDPAGHGITVEGTLPKIPLVRITPGETAFQLIERVARSQDLTLSGTPDGKVKAVKKGAPRKRHAGGLIEGQNIKDADACHDESGQHSQVHVRGQRAFGHGADALEIEAIARDSTIDRKRPIIVVVPEDTDAPRAKSRAKNHRDRAAGRGLTASITVQGFRDEAGTLWEPGRLVWTESDILQIKQDMLIENVTFAQNNRSGSTTRLDVVDPRAHGNAKGKGNKSGKAWKADTSEAEDTTNKEAGAASGGDNVG